MAHKKRKDSYFNYVPKLNMWFFLIIKLKHKKKNGKQKTVAMNTFEHFSFSSSKNYTLAMSTGVMIIHDVITTKSGS